MRSSSPFITEIVGLNEPESDPSARVSPKEVLAWAENDLAAGDKRGVGNALGNVKKALHSRIDEIIAKTHVRFTSGWNPRRVTTEQKLDLIRELGIQHEAIVDVMTSARNDFEHDYILPTARVLRSHLHAAQLWLEKSFTAYEFHPIGFAGLPLLGISAGARRPNGSALGMVTFGEPKPVLCFCIPKKQLLTIRPDGVEESRDFKSFDTKEMLRLEARYIRSALAGGSSIAIAVDEASLMDLLDRYRKWVKDDCFRKGQQGAAPNGGSATPAGNSGVADGPPSVS